MPNFKNPLRDIQDTDLRSLIEQSITDEYEAAFRYRTIANAVQDEKAKKLFADLADEETVHVGELRKLLEILFPEQQVLIDKGETEASEKLLENVDNAVEMSDPAKDTDQDIRDTVSTEEGEKTTDDKKPSNPKRKIRIVRVN